MTYEESNQRLIDYLYGELSPQDKLIIKKELEESEALKRELVSFLQLRELAHEHLPKAKVPAHLSRKVLADLGIRRSWYEIWTQGFLRPSLVAAALILLTLGVTYQVNRWGDEDPTVAKNESSSPTTLRRGSEGDLKYSGPLLARRPLRPSLQPSFARTSPIFQGTPSRSVSLASLGSSPSLQGPSGIPSTELHRLELETEMALAQFLHRAALRMRALGDFSGAAQSLGQLIKKYPFYPYKLQAMAQRIDCLFKAGQGGLAQSELTLLRSISPSLAFLIERRWRL